MGVAAMRVPTVFTAVDKFSSVVSKMTMSVSAFGKTAEAAAMRTSRKFNSAGTSMLTAGAGMAVGIGYVVNEAMTFQDKMANINTILNATPEKMNNIKESIFKVGKETGVPINDLVSNFYELSSAQIYGAKANEALAQSAKLSVLGLGDMTQSTNIMISVLNGFKKEGISAIDVTENIARAIQKGKLKVSDMNESFAKNGALVGLAGVKLKEYLAMQAAMTTAGLPVSDAQNALGLAAINIVKLGPKMRKVMNELGMKNMSGSDIVKHFGGLVPTFIKMGEAAKKLHIPIESIFGRQGAIVANALLTGSALKEYTIEMDYLSKKGINVADAMFKIKQHTTQFKFNILKDEIKELSITLGDALLPRITEMIDNTMSYVKGIMEWADKNKWLASTILWVTITLLKLGVVAKVGAFLFYGLARVIGIVSTITEAYTFVSTMAALANVGFSTALWSTITAMWAFVVAEAAVLAPVLLIIAALGLLTYAMFDSIFNTDNMVSQQSSALDKGNESWRNSTGVVSGELAKQMKLIKNHGKGLRTEYSSPWYEDNRVLEGVHNVISPIIDKEAEKNKGSMFKDPTWKHPYLSPTKSISNNLNLNNTISTNNPSENLAGSNNGLTNDILKNMTKQQVEVYLKGDTSNVSEVRGATVIGGIPVMGKRNQGQR